MQLQSLKIKNIFNKNNLAGSVTHIYILIMLGVYPLFLGFKGYSALTLSKYIFFTVTSIIWLLSIVIIQINPKYKTKPKKTRAVLYFILAYGFFVILSALISKHREAVLMGAGRYDGILTELLLITILIVIAKFGEMRKSYVFALAFSSGICGIITVVQVLGINIFNFFPGEFDFYDCGIKFSSMFLGTLGNVDVYGEFLSICIPLFAVFYIRETKNDYFILAVFFINSLALFLSGVSGALLAIFVTALIAAPLIIDNKDMLTKVLQVIIVLLTALTITSSFSGEKIDGVISFEFNLKLITVLSLIGIGFTSVLLILIRNQKFTARQLHKFFLIFVILSIILGLVFVYLLGDNFEGSIYELYSILHGNIDDKFGSSRVMIWRRALELSKEHFLFGGGPGTFALDADIHFSRFVEETGKTLKSSVDNTHNIYAGILVNTGIFSLVSFLAAQIITIYFSLKKERNCLRISFIMAVISYWIQIFFALGIFIVSPVAWIIWALLISESN